MEKLLQAMDLLREAAEKAREAREILEDDEIIICGYGTADYKNANSQIHIHKYEQLVKFAAAAGIKPEDLVHPERKVYFAKELEIDDYVIGFERDGVFYFTIDPNYKREAETDDISD